jgi:hypothetical protein
VKRPKWSRRGFLAFAGAAAVGLALGPGVAVREPDSILWKFKRDPIGGPGWRIVGKIYMSDFSKHVKDGEQAIAYADDKTLLKVSHPAKMPGLPNEESYGSYARLK